MPRIKGTILKRWQLTWHKATETLPATSDLYWCGLSNGGTSTVAYVASIQRWILDKGLEDFTVTYWTELPAHPESCRG